jgi:arsenate reductase
VIQGCVRTGRAAAVPYAVGVWIGGAYFFTSSTSFANPAVTIARTLADSFAGIEPSSAPMFIVMQLLGALIAFALIRFLYPRRSEMHGARTERLARERLNALAEVEGLQIADRPSVMFMCVHNAGRSQMAAGWLRHLAGEQVIVYSGGSEPADQINPAAIAAMAEVGIDITSEFPKPWTDEIVRASDVVVTMGCGDACPLFPGKRYEDWQLDDPAGQDVAAVIPIRDDIRARVEQLMVSLDITPVHSGR